MNRTECHKAHGRCVPRRWWTGGAATGDAGLGVTRADGAAVVQEMTPSRSRQATAPFRPPPPPPFLPKSFVVQRFRLLAGPLLRHLRRPRPGLTAAWGLGLALVVASCGPSSGPGFSAVRADSLMVSLRGTAEGRGDSAVPFARADSVCAGTSPSQDSGTAERLGGASQVRAFARSKLAKMGFSSCVRVISRVVQRDTWLRVDRVTELVAWRPGEDTLDLIYLPVRYRAPLRPVSTMCPTHGFGQ